MNRLAAIATLLCVAAFAAPACVVFYDTAPAQPDPASSADVGPNDGGELDTRNDDVGGDTLEPDLVDDSRDASPDTADSDAAVDLGGDNGDASPDVDLPDVDEDTGPPVQNDCGGYAVLEGRIAELCGECGLLHCSEDGDSLVCVEMPNECGGCELLTGNVGDACGNCGVLQCDGEDGLTCVDGGANICGGCSEITGGPRRGLRRVWWQHSVRARQREARLPGR